MESLPEMMSTDDWCVFTYRAWHLGDPRARLNLARLYQKCPHLEHNAHYALLWLYMGYNSWLRTGGTDSVVGEELLDEILAVAAQLGEDVAKYVEVVAYSIGVYSFGVSNESAPSDEEVEAHMPSLVQNSV